MAQLPPKVPLHKLSPSWAVDGEFSDFSSERRGSHRRSASDSVAFLEATNNCHWSIINNTCDNYHYDKLTSINGGSIIGGNKNEEFDDEELQFMSMFVVEPPSSPSEDHNNSMNNGEDGKHGMLIDIAAADQLQILQPKSELSAADDEVQSESCNNNDAGLVTESKVVDPKRIKRILANRQSAQRSRVRKLQYVSELERSVTSLQAEVSVLSPRVAYLDHQRLVLNVDNSVLKQRIAALAQDKIFKDAHQEALKKEIERLRQIYFQQQNLKTMENNGSVPSSMAVADQKGQLAAVN